MPAPPELALTADTTEERAAQLQSALKDLSVPDFVRLCAKSAGDELDEAIFDHFSEEDFSRALLQMLTAAAEPEEVEEKPPAAESTPDPDAGKHAFEVFCDCVELDEQLVAYLIDILKRGDKAAREYRQTLADTNSYVLESLRGLRDTLQYQNTNVRAEGITAHSEALGEKQKAMKYREGVTCLLYTSPSPRD